MTDDLDPKLRELEANLRRLKPLDVSPLSLRERANGKPSLPLGEGRGEGFLRSEYPLTLTLSQRERGRSSTLSQCSTLFQRSTLAQRVRGRGFRRTAYIVGATAATILALVWLFPQNQPQSSKNTVIPAIPVIPAQAGIQTEDVLPIFLAPRLRGGDEETFVVILASRLPSDTIPSPTMRQQLAELLDEMNVAELPTVAKQEYPVVEIVVQTSEIRRQTADGRPQEFSFRRTLFDDEMLMKF